MDLWTRNVFEGGAAETRHSDDLDAAQDTCQCAPARCLEAHYDDPSNSGLPKRSFWETVFLSPAENSWF